MEILHLKLIAAVYKMLIISGRVSLNSLLQTTEALYKMLLTLLCVTGMDVNDNISIHVNCIAPLVSLGMHSYFRFIRTNEP